MTDSLIYLRILVHGGVKVKSLLYTILLCSIYDYSFLYLWCTDLCVCVCFVGLVALVRRSSNSTGSV